jgi:hypothetical protein
MRNIPAVVAFSVSSFTCAWSSVICASASRELQTVPQFGQDVVSKVVVAICRVCVGLQTMPCQVATVPVAPVVPPSPTSRVVYSSDYRGLMRGYLSSSRAGSSKPILCGNYLSGDRLWLLYPKHVEARIRCLQGSLTSWCPWFDRRHLRCPCTFPGICRKKVGFVKKLSHVSQRVQSKIQHQA